MPRRKKKNKSLSIVIVIFLALIIVTVRLYEEIGQEKSPSDRFVVIKVIDGDTVELSGGDKLRLLALDTPEKDDPYYQEAKDLLSKLVLGKQARIEYDRTRRDRYGRLLGYLYIDTVLINKVIIENGLGYLYLFKDTELNSSEIKQMLDAQRFAISQKENLWSLVHSAEKYYLSSKSSFRFHRPSCNSIKNANYENYVQYSTRNEALYEGLSPCRNCKP